MATCTLHIRLRWWAIPLVKVASYVNVLVPIDGERLVAFISKHAISFKSETVK